MLNKFLHRTSILRFGYGIKAASIIFTALVLAASPTYGQEPANLERQIRDLVPYSRLLRDVPGLSTEEYNEAVRQVATQEALSRSRQRAVAPGVPSVQSGPPSLIGADGTPLGTLSSNRYDPNSISNPFGRFGSQFSPTSVNNPLSPYGSPTSGISAKNPLATRAPSIVARDGTYLGALSNNTLDPNSVSNPLGRHGSQFSPTSINNPYGRYGSPLSPYSVTNPYAAPTPSLPALPTLGF